MASGSFTSWQIKGQKVKAVSGFIFLSCKIIGNDDCSHEIKRHLLRSISHLLCRLHCGWICYHWAIREALLGRKVMTNLGSIIKSRDITLPTKVHIVKAIIFPLVMYDCESCSIKKTECWRIDAFKFWHWRRLLRVQTSQFYRKSILNIYSKDWCWSWSSNTLTIWCEEPTHWKRPWCQERFKAKGEGAAEDEILSITNWMDMNLSKLWDMVEDRGSWHATVHRVTQSQAWLSSLVTEQQQQIDILLNKKIEDVNTKLQSQLFYILFTAICILSLLSILFTFMPSTLKLLKCALIRNNKDISLCNFIHSVERKLVNIYSILPSAISWSSSK